ncbi:heavy-metal-associated domain-containing protein [Nocardiopsis trehalosi]|jgi:copper chaperone CopZ|uniref:heavy-metal-associated domain-containing protein n=1 Tax=Nocardiopsis trehalosi TaxID=109329 RepID=UPI00082AE035|nr:heavy metal-associated domain-containing protein [Nocardiopsis trehalosi]
MATTITVSGMTCGHCVNAVKEEVSALPGVTSVDVELDSGRVTIDGTEPIDPDRLTAAIDEAGYTIVA